MNPTQSPKSNLILLLQAWQAGNKTAMDELIPLIYNELHRISRTFLLHNATKVYLMMQSNCLTLNPLGGGKL
ncbi:hypothetical protein [Acanthopleuribacter pedis]|uniref:Uncharacterized protein n=1 Tax=Acanthopleuribacter pedis TaxID=442870 RepID=A0A8J7QHA8_9BACT|nr:hypothetical protein [Acanthopleuribacter pedis]MBO1322410.1 hypothetical protein [Acanthopleuribacter pedis]